MNNIGVVQLILNEGVSNGSTYITGGLGGQANTSLTMNGSSYYIDGGAFYAAQGDLTMGSTPPAPATYYFDGGATVNSTAPTDNCVSAADYPKLSYEAPNSPYDGTNGEGICGIAIYQARGDASTDTVNEGAASTFNGGIYAPSAPLIMSGAGALNISTDGIPGLVVASINDSGSGNIKIAETAEAGGGGVISSTALLVQ
jgi:hypothetical protein